MRPGLRLVAGSGLLASPFVGLAHGQAGDRDGEEQPPLPPDLAVPAAPVLAPADALASFELAPGLAIELVCAEPLVVDPVTIAFDGDGRMWVCEMRGFMPDPDGAGELERTGRIAILTDPDGDGTYDERVDFLDGLVLPRAVAPALGGALVIEPPDLLFCRDTDGDGRADEREVIDTGFTAGLRNPEHAINGLLYGLDNWFGCANHDRSYRFDGESWVQRPTSWAGQWGLAQDDVGRLYFNTNSDPLRWHRVSSHYARRNPNHGAIAGIDEGLVRDRSVWPIRVTPGVNRGYRAGTLRDDGTLRVMTAACSPLVWRGTELLADWVGDAFVCEPSGNLVKRYVFTVDDDGRRWAENAWEGRELLASTDERFRPVHLAHGPDGALYVVDLYRGILQHRNFLTSFLRRQIEERGLAEPAGLGRIWRIRRTDAEPRRVAPMSDASWTELAAHLSHRNGWVRDTAQRLIVEDGRGSRDAYDLTRAVLVESSSPLGRMHAVWALAGIGGLDRELLDVALADPDERVVRAAVRGAERALATGAAGLAQQLVDVARERGRATRHQVLLSLGAGRTPACEAALHELAVEDVGDADLRSAILSGLARRELEFALRLVADPLFADEREGRVVLVRLLARAVAREHVSERVERLLDAALSLTPNATWQRDAWIAGLLDGRPPAPKGGPGALRLQRAPGSLALLRTLAEDHEPARELLVSLRWPGRHDVPPEERVEPLTERELERFERGRATYARICSACHLASGRGSPGQAPPLRHSPWVLGDDTRLVRILLHGLEGPITIGGRTWNAEMPAWSGSDEELASVLTYIRREWGHGADAVDPARVAEIREATGPRAGPWTVEEL